MAKGLKDTTRMSKFTSDEEAQYRLRSSFMYRNQKILANAIETLKSTSTINLDWHDPREIGISQTAFDYVKSEGTQLIHVFCHPKIIESNPSLILYYRSLAGLPQKGIKRIAFDVAKYETGAKISMGDAVDLAKVLNSYISEIIDSDPKFSITNAQLMIAMSYGAQMNGSWRNAVGDEGVARIKQILVGFLRDRKVIRTVTYKEGIVISTDKPIDVEQVQEITLTNNYTLRFSSDPDISLRDSSKLLISVIEVKAGIDPAGAFERYGAAKKSFSRAKRENKNVETLYLGLLTDAVKKELKDDQLVTKEYSIGAVFSNQQERQDFLNRVLWLSHLEPTRFDQP